jgi:glutamate synthase (NADPH/NADH) large chain
MIAEGCVMARQCHLNTCPVGITTQDKRLREKFPGKPEHIINYLKFVAQEVRQYLADMGYRSLDEIIGRVDLLKPAIPTDHYKAKKLKLDYVLQKPDFSKPIKCIQDTNPIPQSKQPFDLEVLKDALPAIEKDENFSGFYVLRNTYRSFGARIAHEIVKRYGDRGLRTGKLELNLRGTAGQSFGAFCVPGMILSLTGQANDYVGKGMVGGIIIIKPPKEFKGESHKNVIAGNIILYGATGGQVYISGMVGERFAVRNSGATAVVEGAGDHGCEYMTEGTVLILGKISINFGAGMTGGTAYIHDPEGEVDRKINKSYVKTEALEEEDIEEINKLLLKHVAYTESKIAKHILDNFKEEINNFVKVVALESKKPALDTDEAVVGK